MQSGQTGRNMLVKVSRDVFLRPLEIVMGIVERRHESHPPFLRRKAASKFVKSKAGSKSTLHANTCTASTGSDQSNPTESGGGSGDGGGDGDPDSDRRKIHPQNPPNAPRNAPKSSRRPAKRRASQDTSLVTTYQSALIGACLLFILYLSVMMIFAFTNQSELAKTMLMGLPSVAWIINCFIKPK